MSLNRCDKCGNLHRYCQCHPKPGDAPPIVTPPTPYEKALRAIRSEAGYMGGPDDDYEPTLLDFMLEALPTPCNDGLYLCRRGCGITADAECDYGGWHGAQGHESVSLDVIAEPDHLARSENP